MKLIFEGSKPEAGKARTFLFTSPALPSWVAGQSIKIAVPGPYGPIDRRFTISAAPAEKVVAITTRPSDSAYKQSLWQLQPGDEVDAYAIEGDFIWRDTKVPHVFIAGGIGVTPFRSMLWQRVHEGKPLNATLLYRSHHFFFKEEFDAWQHTHPEFTVRYLTGQLDAGTIAAEAQGLVYLSGPSLMVDDLSAELLRRGIEEPRLVRDWFTGRLPSDG